MSNATDVLLDQQQQLLHTICGLLKQEREAITDRQPEVLVALLENKMQLLGEVESNDKVIKAALVNQSPSLAQDEKIALIRSLLEECKQLTSINQQAVSKSQVRLNHLKHLLVEGRQKESMTYDKAGQVTGGTRIKGIKA
jgi:flagella synthesis protein FlgN